MISLLSVAPPPSPRAIQARNAFSRRSRRAENCRNGSMLEREVVGPESRAPRPSHAPPPARNREGQQGPPHRRGPACSSARPPTHAGAERGETRVDVDKPRLGGGVQRRARTQEFQIIALENAPLFRGQRELIACAIQTLDTAEQGRVHVDTVPVPGLDGRNLALDREDFVVVVGAGQEVEDVDRPCKRLATSFERGDGVGESRRRRIACDRGNLSGMRSKCASKGHPEMIRLDAAEIGHTERAAPFLEQRIVMGVRG
jgi:hypothetical protein